MRIMLPVMAGLQAAFVSSRKFTSARVPQSGSEMTIALYCAKSDVVMLFHSSGLAMWAIFVVSKPRRIKKAGVDSTCQAEHSRCLLVLQIC